MENYVLVRNKYYAELIFANFLGKMSVYYANLRITYFPILHSKTSHH